MSDRLDRILEVPWEVLEYEQWLGEHAGASDDYLFATAKVRFEAHAEDRPRVPDDLTLSETRGALRLSSARLGGGMLVEGVKRSAAERLLGRCDGARTLAELRVLAGAERPTFERLLAQTLGALLFVPEAVRGLEERLSGVELVRFVGAPYEIVRAYWTNMAAVRAHAESALGARAEGPSARQSGDRPETGLTLESFLTVLRRLHVLALLGEDLQSFYRPASRITRGGARPGSFFETASCVVPSSVGPLILRGPRVGVSPSGGERYHALLCTRAGDPEATGDRALALDGLELGRVLTGRAVDDATNAAWFCPPRPLLPAHFERLFSAHQRAERDTDPHPALAEFHWLFVRLHPFRCANQSLAMNLVNRILGRARGAGIPHLILDQLALRLNLSAYTRVFRVAVDGHAVSERAEARWSVLNERKMRAYGLIQQLQSAKSDGEAHALAAADPEAARLALLCE